MPIVERVRKWVVSLMLTAAAGAGAETATSPDKLYREYCSVCHGDNGDGDTHVRGGLQPPPRDFTTPQAAAELTRERMIASVSEGRPGTAMTAWKGQLSAVEIAAVVDYVREHFMQRPLAAALARGARIYARTCSVCHGDNGSGAVWGHESLDPPPRDFTAPAALRDLSRERMIASVTYGRPGTAMAAFGSQLSADDVGVVVDYIRKMFMKVADEGTAVAQARGDAMGGGNAGAPAVEVAAQYPDGLQGDPATGEAYYLQNCTACHGAAGDGNGPRAYFIFPKPRNFIHPSARGTFDRGRLFRAIKEGVAGREMPAWGKVLSDQQIADVAEYVFEAFISGSATGDTARSQ